LFAIAGGGRSRKVKWIVISS